jgi:hypothetical protein
MRARGRCGDAAAPVVGLHAQISFGFRSVDLGIDSGMPAKSYYRSQQFRPCDLLTAGPYVSVQNHLLRVAASGLTSCACRRY